MNKIANALVQLQRHDEGLTTVEYAIAGGLIGLALIGAFTALGGEVGTVITAITTAITPAAA
jgi:pilus assembly protein Flp/PilA